MKKRQWFEMHSFIGVWTGLLLFVVCFSGTVATLSYEIDWLLTPAMQVEPEDQSQARPWSEIYAKVARQYPEASVQMISLPRYANAAAEVVIKPQDPNAARMRIFVNPYTSDVTGAFSTFNTQRFFRSFHRHFFIPKPAGIYLVAIGAVAILVSLLSALYFYKRWWTRFFQFKPGKARAWISELHKLCGLWSVWFAFLIAVTGIWYGLEATGAPHQLLAPEKSEAPAIAETDRPLSLEQLETVVEALRPEWAVRRVIPPGSFLGENRLQVIGASTNPLLRDRVNNLSLTTGGEVIASATAEDLTAFEFWVNIADPLHFGYFGGLASKLIWFVMGILLTGICLSGTWLYLKRLRRRPQDRRQGTAAAGLIIAMVLFAAIGLGLQHYQDATKLPAWMAGPALPPAVAGFIAVWLITAVLVTLGCIWFLCRGSAQLESNGQRVGEGAAGHGIRHFR